MSQGNAQSTTAYAHTQIGHVVIIALAGGLLLCAGLLLALEPNAVALGVLVVLALCLLLFCTLTVTIDNVAMTIRFGPGPIRKHWPLAEIAELQVVRNPWYYGWGIHLTPHGWLFNVSGTQAVQITLRNGRRYRIGSDEPEALAQALCQRLERLVAA